MHTTLDTPRVQVGQHVGVGCLVDSCLTCAACLRGDEQKCSKSVYMQQRTTLARPCLRGDECKRSESVCPPLCRLLRACLERSYRAGLVHADEHARSHTHAAVTTRVLRLRATGWDVPGQRQRVWSRRDVSAEIQNHRRVYFDVHRARAVRNHHPRGLPARVRRAGHVRRHHHVSKPRTGPRILGKCGSGQCSQHTQSVLVSRGATPGLIVCNVPKHCLSINDVESTSIRAESGARAAKSGRRLGSVCPPLACACACVCAWCVRARMCVYVPARARVCCVLCVYPCIYACARCKCGCIERKRRSNSHNETSPLEQRP
jgi:hypothetical protein